MPLQKIGLTKEQIADNKECRYADVNAWLYLMNVTSKSSSTVSPDIRAKALAAYWFEAFRCVCVCVKSTTVTQDIIRDFGEAAK